MGSKFELYSLGIAIEDKKPNLWELKVCPIEHLTMVSGPLTKTFNVKSSLPNAKGVVETKEATGEQSIVAKWTPIHTSNRQTPPDVRASEHVLIYTYGDTNEYYWSTVFSEPSLRKLEEVYYVYSNVSAQGQSFDLKSSYWVCISTLNKKIHVHTCKNDGERVAYDLLIDTKRGMLSVTDNAGGVISMDSSTKEIKLAMTNIVLDGNVKVNGVVTAKDHVKG
jgi:hypothetical protein